MAWVSAAVRGLLTAVAAACLFGAAQAAPRADGLLFHVSADAGFVADYAAADPVPNVQEKMALTPDGKSGSAIQRGDDGALAWKAPGNIYAQRGTVAFFWRPRTPLAESPFVIFRTGFAAHSSFDMVFLRIDWNGRGFDALVTDANLAQVRVAFRTETVPTADAWRHLAFAWDEAVGVRLFLDGVEVARKDQKVDLDSGLDQLGLAGRAMSPHQTHSRYNFTRGSDVDELRVYDRMLDATSVAALSRGASPASPPTADAGSRRQAWLHRFGWDRSAPPVLAAASTRIRKVEFADAKDLKQMMWKGVDGVPETTWPGTYNRSRLPGRMDDFVLPDWNVYVDGGKVYDLTLPAEETFNRVEIRGAAYGALGYSPDGASYQTVQVRPQGVVRSVAEIARRRGGRLRFSNVAQETPIQEIWAYDVGAGREPAGTAKLSYVVQSQVEPAFGALTVLHAAIAGRHPLEERATVVALPADRRPPTRPAAARAPGAPIVHVLVPSGFDDTLPAQPLHRGWNYGWRNMHSGLDGVALDIPPLALATGSHGLIPLNIRIKDPVWPGRDMIDVSVSVRPNEARTLWLDLRDRILTHDSLWLTIASAAPDFGPAAVDGMAVRLVFKDRTQAKVEHVTDRFQQVRDNWSFLVEARPMTRRAGLYDRLYTDLTDLLRVDPDHEQGRLYRLEIADAGEDWPAFEQPRPPAGTPLWAFRQLEDLKLVRRFITWWIDERQVEFGDFGGGISDDSDMIAQWPGLALMGVEPDKVRTSLNRLADAVYANGMITNGLGTIATDELHAYEEGLNSDAAALYLNWGDPLRVERLMATTRALKGIVTRNPAGHLHFSSNWYGGRTVYRDGGPWNWQKLYSFVVMHGPILLGTYNGSPEARGLVTGAMDGLLAHGKQEPDGLWSFPNEINWATDAERVGDPGGGASRLQSAWTSWRWTGDDKYLRPIVARAKTGGAESLADITENAVDALGERGEWGAPPAQGAEASPFRRYLAWQTTGDKAWLEDLHADAIREKSQRMYMVTEGHWWTDRVEQPSEILQRERLGGVALKRGWMYPGHTVSWRFAEPGGGELVAILVAGAELGRFKVIAHNVSARPQRAAMTTWNVTAGRWRVTSGIDRDGDDRGDGVLATRRADLERSASIDFEFAPGVTTVMEFELEQPTTPTEQRPDLGIGQGDVTMKGGELRVKVHSLGAVAAPGGTLTLEDAAGRILATSVIPPLAAPTDLLPKTWTTRLRPPRGARVAGARVRVALAGDAPEVTRLNNLAVLP